MRSTVLEGVARLGQVLHAIVERNDACDFLPHLLARRATERVPPFWIRGQCNVAQDLPFRPRFAHLAGDFGREHHAPLGARFRAAVVLFVAGLGGQQENLVPRFEQHLVGDNDVLVHPQGHALQRFRDVLGIGHRTQQVAADEVKYVELPSIRGFQHFSRRIAGLRRDRETVLRGQRFGIRGVDRFAAGKRGGVRAHLGAALDGGVPANRHDATVIAAEPAAREREVEDHPDTVRAPWVLRDAHAPDDDTGARAGHELREVFHARARQTRGFLQFGPVERADAGDQFRPADRVVVEERLIGAADRVEVFECAVQECDVATLGDRVPVIGDVGAEERALGGGGHPVPLHARLEVGIDQHDLGAGLLGQV